MTTVLQARPRRFVTTPSIDRVAKRALRYLQSGYPVHLRGPAGTGKTTLALHLADLISRPIMLLFGDDEFKTSDLIGNQLGYTRKKVVDNFIHSVVKMEDELRHNWVDSRLTLACREGFTLVYDEFNRSRPEVNNVLLSALEEKLLVLPPNGNRTEYIRVDPHFRAIFTSNPEEYCGVHDTQDALLDRMITINMPEPDELTQQEIVVHKTGINRHQASLIVQLVRAYRTAIGAANSSGLRPCLMIAKVCAEHDIEVMPANEEFRDVCQDMLLSRTKLPLTEATQLLWNVFNDLMVGDSLPSRNRHFSEDAASDAAELTLANLGSSVGSVVAHDAHAADAATGKTDNATPVNTTSINGEENGEVPPPKSASPDAHFAANRVAEPIASEAAPTASVPYEAEVYAFFQHTPAARPSDVEAALGINRFQTVNALRSLVEKGQLIQHRNGEKSAYHLSRPEASVNPN
jgi:gas vesicle protein GvpN